MEEAKNSNPLHDNIGAIRSFFARHCYIKLIFFCLKILRLKKFSKEMKKSIYIVSMLSQNFL